MGKCVICGKDSGKGKTCSSKCRKVLSRQSVTKDCDKPSVTVKRTKAGVTVYPEPVKADIKFGKLSLLPANFGQTDCQCKHCRAVKVNGSKHTLNHGAYKTVSQLADNELNRVSLPGDIDYAGLCSKPHEDSSGWTKA